MKVQLWSELINKFKIPDEYYTAFKKHTLTI